MFFELLVEGGIRVGRAPFQRRDRAHPLLAGAGLLMLGAGVGLVVSLAFPRPFFRFAVMPGASLFLSPLLNGAVMEYYGQWIEKRTGSRSFIATFWGGALFAFGMAAVRFLMTRER